MKKKIFALAMAAVMVFGIAACSSKKEEAPAAGDTTQKEETKTPEAMSGTISVISREEGSGTRGAFVELMEVVDSNKNDMTTVNAEITNSTSVALSTVAGDKQAIGYISLGSLSSEVKAVKVDGVEATTENIKGGTYKVSRPFLLVYKDGKLSDIAQDYLKFIMSSDGQKLVSDNGYITAEDNAQPYTASGLSGKLVLAGSTSVSPLMEKIADAYKALNPNVSVEIQQTGSGAGITSAIDDVCDFGMSSRDLKDSEAKELVSAKIAMDGIAVIVNNANPTDNLTSEQIKSIYLGETTDWSAIK